MLDGYLLDGWLTDNFEQIHVSDFLNSLVKEVSDFL